MKIEIGDTVSDRQPGDKGCGLYAAKDGASGIFGQWPAPKALCLSLLRHHLKNPSHFQSDGNARLQQLNKRTTSNMNVGDFEGGPGKSFVINY